MFGVNQVNYHSMGGELMRRGVGRFKSVELRLLGAYPGLRVSRYLGSVDGLLTSIGSSPLARCINVTGRGRQKHYDLAVLLLTVLREA